MVSATVALLSVCLVALVVSSVIGKPQQEVPNKRASPCTNLFRYESDQPGQWTGNLAIESEDDLHGVWIRLIFDGPLKEVTVDGDYEVVSSSDVNEVLIKNRHVLLKAGSATNVKITVKYDGDKFPNLTGYRLNARTLCPEPNTKREDFFEGDSSSKDFLAAVLSTSKPIKTESECYLKPLHIDTKFPFGAAIFLNIGNDQQLICEGALISPSHVLTSAHCVTFKDINLEVPVSSLSVHFEERDEPISKTVSKIKVHPGYVPNNLFNDIAVLQLSDPLIVNDYHRPICVNDREASGQEQFLVGLQDASKPDAKIIKVQAKEISEEDCAKKSPELKNLIGDNSYCVSYLKGGICNANSGSIFIASKDDVPTLKGIVSVGATLQGKSECNEDTTVIVTDVTKYAKWILSTIH